MNGWRTLAVWDHTNGNKTKGTTRRRPSRPEWTETTPTTSRPSGLTVGTGLSRVLRQLTHTHALTHTLTCSHTHVHTHRLTDTHVHTHRLTHTHSHKQTHAHRDRSSRGSSTEACPRTGREGGQGTVTVHCEESLPWGAGVG